MLNIEVFEAELARAREWGELPSPPLRSLLRERAGLSRAALARALGVHRAVLSRWESGARTPRNPRPYLDALERLLRAGQ
jgi:DNA-binding transcriptional regulator YiaG